MAEFGADLGETDVNTGTHHGTNDFAVANLVQIRIGFGIGRDICTDKWRLPDLKSVMLYGGIIAAEADLPAIVKEQKTIANKWGLHMLLDHVV